MMKIFSFLTALILIGSIKPSFGQTPKQITGRLINDKNTGIDGATVSLVSTGVNTQTDNNGFFNLEYNGRRDTIFISHVGYSYASIAIDSATTFPLEIQLVKKEGVLQEVVVHTGYQQVSKERSTGSFTKISNSTFNQQAGYDIISRLPAIANGLQEGLKTNEGNYSSAGKIMIRGLSTINGPTSPLIILDNFPYEGDIQNINPNDVESITLLKDAAAASIWGARAGNGVIVITTKKGHYSQKANVEFRSNIQFTEKPDLFYQQSISPSDLVDVEKFLFQNGYRMGDTLSSSHPPFSPVYEILIGQKNGSISNSDAGNQLNLFRSHDVRNDFNKYVYTEGISQQYNISVNGGSDNIAWLLSGGYDKNLDVLSAATGRVNIRSDNSIKLSKGLEANTSIYYAHTETTSGAEGYGNVRTIKGSIPVYSWLIDKDGKPVPVAKDFRSTFTGNLPDGSLLDWNYYPLEDFKHSRSKAMLEDIVGALSLSYSFHFGLVMQAKYQYEKQTAIANRLYDIDSYYTRNLINSFYQPSGPDLFPVPKRGILDASNNTLTSTNLRLQVNYNKKWRNQEVVAIAGNEVRQLLSEGNSNRRYGYDDNILTVIPVDLSNSYKSYVTGSSMYIPDFNGLTERNNRLVSFFANAAYTLKNKYTLSISGRRDASNIFGVNTNDKWNPLWSAGAGWTLSQETFYKSSLIPYFRLRITYGASGNIDPSLSAVTTMSYSGTSPFTRSPYGAIDKFYNPDLRWEKNGQLNLGIDFSTRNDYLKGSIEYYVKKGIDLYGPSPLDQTAGLGIGYITKNAANMIANGWDIELHSVNTNSTIIWSTDLNLSGYHDKITAYYLLNKEGYNFISDGNRITGLTGKPVNSVLSYKWGGLNPETGNPRGYLDGKISEDYTSITGSGTLVSDLIYSGPGLPTIFGSIGNTLLYKGFSLTARMIFKFGYYFRKPSVNYNTLFSALSSTADFAKRWQKPGDELKTNVPSMIYPLVNSRDEFYNNSQVLVEKGDQVRLQYITLSYKVTNKSLKRTPFKSLRVYVNVNNLGIIWRANKDRLDPDYSVFSIPPSKNIAIGTQINF